MLSIFTHQYRVMNSTVKLLNIKNKNKPEMEVWALGNWKQEARRSEAGGLRDQESQNSQIKTSLEKRNKKFLRKGKSWSGDFPLALSCLYPNLHSPRVTIHWALNRFLALGLASTKWTHIYVWLQERTQRFRVWLKSHLNLNCIHSTLVLYFFLFNFLYWSLYSWLMMLY